MRRPISGNCPAIVGGWDDLGRTWTETPNGAIRFPADTGSALERIWQIQPGRASEPDVIYAGTEPSALFRSADRGEHFEMVRPLWDHPHRPQWNAGYGGQAIHTVLPHPDDTDRIMVAMSGGGVYRTDDGGGSWQSIADGLPSDFGFPIVVHPRWPDTVYLFPLVADSERFPPGAAARVWRSDDAGATWRGLGTGLPDGFWAAVMRDALCTDGADPAGLYLGARDGSLFASVDEGESWRQVAAHLPDVLCVRSAVLD